VRERGCHEEGEDERSERPERPVKVGRGRQVGGGVRRREGVKGVHTAGKNLYSERGLMSQKASGMGGKHTVLVSTSKWC
jgi:hypothetical protein